MSASRGPAADAAPPEKRMRLRFAGVCRVCGRELPAHTWAVYERTAKTVRCETCPMSQPHSDLPPGVATGPNPSAEALAAHGKAGDVTLGVPVDQPAPGVAGASARREFERRRSAREERIRTKHPRLGGLMLAVSDDPQSTKAWAVGAHGEERLGRRLDGIAGPSVRVLHDRRIPRSRANIDHIVTCPGGVFVIDAKQYQGRPQLRVDGGIFRERTEKMLVGSRDCSKLVDGVLKQVGLVRDVIADESVPVRGFLCFVDADWPLFGGSFTTRQVTVLWPKKLVALITEPGHLTDDAIAAIDERLTKAFPVA